MALLAALVARELLLYGANGYVGEAAAQLAVAQAEARQRAEELLGLQRLVRRVPAPPPFPARFRSNVPS